MAFLRMLSATIATYGRRSRYRARGTRLIDHALIRRNIQCLAVVLASATAGCGGSTEPGGPAPDGHEWNEIAFVRFQDKNPQKQTWQLAVVNADGSNLRLLTDTLWIIGGAQFSPDGARIVFAGSANPSVADAKTLADRPGGLWLINRDGTGLVHIDSPATAEFPHWSPDGRQLVFSAEQAINVWIENADGTSAHAITSGPEGDLDPVFSPDGRTIAFSRRAATSTQSAIFVMNADGSNPRRLTDYAQYNRFPSWNGDGSQLTFGHVGDDGSFLATIRPDGTGFGRFTPSVTDVFYSSWRPDGKAVVFSTPLFDGVGLFLLDIASGQRSALTPQVAHVRDGSPSWGRTR
jgi:TolB protein